MTLAQVQVAAEAYLLKTLSHDGLRKALSSRQAFEELYLELTRAAADNYHRSSRRRHGVVMDGEVRKLRARAAVSFCRIVVVLP